MTDLERLEQEYARRDADPAYEHRHGRGDPAHERALATRSAAVARILTQAGLASLDGRRVLDVGCGRGDSLATFPGGDCVVRMGLDPLPRRLLAARERLPHAHFVAADARHPPLRKATFDVVQLFTVLTALPDGAARRELVEAVLPLLRAGGVLLIYDFRRYPGRDRGIDPRDVRALLPGRSVHAERITLAPPLARAVAPRAPALAAALERVPFLRTHDLYWTVQAQMQTRTGAVSA